MTRLAGNDFAAARAPAQAAGRVLEATRQSLLERLKDHGDRVGWERFFELYGGAIHGLALKAGLAPSDADDVLQEVLIIVSKQMPEFKYDPALGSFKGWLFQITRRRIADHFRKRKPSVALDEELADGGAAGSLEGQWDEEWRRGLLKAALESVKAQVSARQWQMFDLSAVQEWPMERITALLGCNRAQVYMAKMRLSRMARQEAERLGRENPFGG